MSYFAKRLKLLRQESGLTMQALADQAAVSKSMICKIENDEVQPTIDVAGKIANALGRTLSEMLHRTREHQVVYLTKDEQAIWEDAQHIKRRNISPVFEGLKTEWLHVELPPKTTIVKSSPGLSSPGGEKYVLVIKGTLELLIETKLYKMKKGDSIYFDTSYPHEFRNATKELIEFYVVVKHP